MEEKMANAKPAQKSQNNAIRPARSNASQKSNAPKKNADKQQPGNVGRVTDIPAEEEAKTGWPKWEWHDFDPNSNDVAEWFVNQLAKAIPATLSKYGNWFSACIDNALIKQEAKEKHREALKNFRKTEKKLDKAKKKEDKAKKKEDKAKKKEARKKKKSAKELGTDAKEAATKDSNDKRTGAVLNGKKKRFAQTQQRISNAKNRAKQLAQRTGNKIRAARGARANRGNDGR